MSVRLQIDHRAQNGILRGLAFGMLLGVATFALGTVYFANVYGSSASPITIATVQGPRAIADVGSALGLIAPRDNASPTAIEARRRYLATTKTQSRIFEELANDRSPNALRLAALAQPQLALGRPGRVTGSTGWVAPTRSPSADAEHDLPLIGMVAPKLRPPEQAVRLASKASLAQKAPSAADPNADQATSAKLTSRIETASLPASTGDARATREKRVARVQLCSKELPSLAQASRLQFPVGVAAITPSQRTRLSTLAALLKQCPRSVLEVGGHTDRNGTDATNFKLSWRRAEAVAEILETEGVAKQRLVVVGYGPQRPVADRPEATTRSYAPNRRVELIVR
ncbi:MAG: OmpA family protein [Pseudomonadota bacterium]